MGTKQFDLLRDAIREHGFTLNSFASALNLTYLQLYRRLAGEIQFTIGEVNSMSKLLDLSDADIFAIFFCR